MSDVGKQFEQQTGPQRESQRLRGQTFPRMARMGADTGSGRDQDEGENKRGNFSADYADGADAEGDKNADGVMGRGWGGWERARWVEVLCGASGIARSASERGAWGVAWLLGAVVVQAGEVDKTGYSWANPTPDHLLRELTTDRPDATESPYTVDAGRAQLEMNFADYERTGLDGDKTVVVGVAPFNLRVGVRHNLELGVFVSPYTRVTETPRGGPGVKTAGFGDVTLRGKWNFWGNDGGATALGLMVDVTLPTAKSGLGVEKTEGAVTLPFAFELGGGWAGAAMTAVELHRNAANTGYRAAWFNTLTVGHDIAGDLAGFLEVTSAAGEGRHVAIFNAGLTYGVNANTQLDCGVGLGISRTAPDVGVFAGVSKRF